MKKKTFLALLLALCMLASTLAGCGSSEEPSGGQSDNPGESQPAGNEDPNAPEDSGETAEIVVGCMTFAPVDEKDQDRIEALVNEKMKEMINVTADFIWYDASSYGTQIPMMIQAGEQLDAMMYTPVPAASFTSFLSQGQLMDISEYVDQYGPDIKAALGEAGLAGTTRNGGLYGVSAVIAQSSQMAIAMRTDVLEEIGRLDDFNNMTTWSEYEDILKAAVAAGYPGMANADAEGTVLNPQPYMVGEENFSDCTWVDVGGSGNQQVYIDPADDTVKCFFEAESYKQSMIRAGKFYEEGLIYKDSATSMDFGATQIKNGVSVAWTNGMDFGGEETIESSCGYPMTVKYVDGAKSKLSTSSFCKFGWVVPVTAQEPAAAVKFLNLLYSENAVHETLAWGEEGVDWIRNEDGTATYPNGGTSAAYHMNDFMYGDILSIPPWSNDPDLRTKQRESNAGLEASKYIGFAVDNSEVVNLVTACQNVANEYKPTLSSGVYGSQTEAKWQEFVDALYAAGMADILAEYQSQLDTWLAEQ